MNTQIYTEKNGSGVLSISAKTEEEAYFHLVEIVKNVTEWRFSETVENE